MSEQIRSTQMEETWIPIPENVLGGHPDSTEIMVGRILHGLDNAIFSVQKMFKGPIHVLEHADEKGSNRLVIIQIPGTTLMVEPYDLKVAIARQDLSGDEINEILEALAAFVNADVNIRYIRESMMAINKLIDEVGAGVGAVFNIEFPDYDDLRAIIIRKSFMDLASQSPEGILTQIKSHSAFGHLGHQCQTRINALFKLRRFDVKSLCSHGMTSSGRALSIFVDRLIEHVEKERNSDNPEWKWPSTYMD